MDLRPTLETHDVTFDYAVMLLAEVKASHGDLHALSDEASLSDLHEAVCSSDDAYMRTLFLHDRGWIVNEALVDILHERTKQHASALTAAEMAWVVKTGVRFPAKEGDTVTFHADTGFEKNGSVVGVTNSTAAGYVQVRSVADGKKVEWVVHRVMAEKIKTITTAKGAITKVEAVTRITG